jgi:hypothetical protein
MRKIIPILGLVSILAIACEKNSFNVTERKSPPEGAALVKFAPVSATTNGVTVLVYINGERVSYPLPYNTPFPGGGLSTGGSNNSDFLVVNPGNSKVEFNVPVQGTSIFASKFFETTQNFEGGKRQILFIADTAANTAAWLVMVDGNIPDSGFAGLQFVNAMPNVASVDFYKGANAGTATVVASDVKYKMATNYLSVPFGADSFFVRIAGSAANSTPIARGRITTANQRLYTFYSRGYNGITTGNRLPAISAIINQ